MVNNQRGKTPSLRCNFPGPHHEIGSLDQYVSNGPLETTKTAADIVDLLPDISGMHQYQSDVASAVADQGLMSRVSADGGSE